MKRIIIALAATALVAFVAVTSVAADPNLAPAAGALPEAARLRDVDISANERDGVLYDAVQRP